MNQQSVKDEASHLRSLILSLNGKAVLIIAGTFVCTTVAPTVPEPIVWPFKIALFLSLALSLAVIWPSSATSAYAASWPNIVEFPTEDEAIDAICNVIDEDKHYSGQFYQLSKLAKFKTNLLRGAIFNILICCLIYLLYY